MAQTAARLESLRFNRREIRRLGLVLALSLLAHLLLWGGYEAARELQVWRWIHRLAWLQPAPKIPPVQQSEPPLEFVTVEQPSTEAPKNAKFYSNNNSLAANPDANRDLNIPKLNGTQTDVPKTETVLKPDFNKLRPAPKPMTSEPAQPTPAVQPGDFSLGKPQPQTPPRPRTLQEARAQQHLPGVQMLQDGGVQRRAIAPSFDVKLTGFGDYDARFYEAVCQRWWDLLDSQQFARDRTGKVTLQFHLNHDGTISEMKVAQNDVGEVLGYVCQKAVLDPAPFERFPTDMRLKLGDYANIKFTFYYY
jgi:hypothetical protein